MATNAIGFKYYTSAIAHFKKATSFLLGAHTAVFNPVMNLPPSLAAEATLSLA